MRIITSFVAGTLVIGVVCCGARPTSTRPSNDEGDPTTRPAAIDSLAEAKAGVEIAQSKCLEGLKSSPKYREAKSKADAALLKLQDARANGTPQDRLTASHNFVAANQVVKTIENAALTQDEAYLEAKKHFVTIQQQVKESKALADGAEHERKNEEDFNRAHPNFVPLLKKMQSISESKPDSSQADRYSAYVAQSERLTDALMVIQGYFDQSNLDAAEYDQLLHISGQIFSTWQGFLKQHERDYPSADELRTAMDNSIKAKAGIELSKEFSDELHATPEDSYEARVVIADHSLKAARDADAHRKSALEAIERAKRLMRTREGTDPALPDPRPTSGK